MWPPASAGQPPNMHIGHPGTPTAQHPFAHHPFGAGAGCGCAAAHLFLLAHDRVVVIGARALSLPRSRTPCPQLKLAPPGTARTPKSCTATPLRPSTRAARCSIRRAQQHAWRGPTAASTACLASCMRSASRQVSDRPMITPPHRPLPAPTQHPPASTPARPRVPLHEGCSRAARFCGRRARLLARKGVLRSGRRRAVGCWPFTVVARPAAFVWAA